MEFLIAALIALGVALLFVLGDRNLGGDERSALARYLTSGRDEKSAARALPDAFLQWFDRVLRVRHVKLGRVDLPLPSFRRSLLISVLALSFAAAMWVAKKGLLEPQNLGAGLLNARVGLPLFVMYALGAFVSNLIPDYLSLVQSRYVLERMRRTDRLSVQLGWLVLDLLLTAAMVFGVLWLTARSLMPLVPEHLSHFIGCLRGEDLSLAEFGKIYWGGITFSSPVGTQNYDAAGVYIYSSFLTSFWVWLFMASALMVKVAAFIPGLRRFLADEVRMSQAPLRALSLGAVLVAGALMALPSVAAQLRDPDPHWVDGSQSWHEPIDRCRQRRLEAHMRDNGGMRRRYYDYGPTPGERSRYGGW